MICTLKLSIWSKLFQRNRFLPKTKRKEIPNWKFKNQKTCPTKTVRKSIIYQFVPYSHPHKNATATLPKLCALSILYWNINTNSSKINISYKIFTFSKRTKKLSKLKYAHLKKLKWSFVAVAFGYFVALLA